MMDSQGLLRQVADYVRIKQQSAKHDRVEQI